jgi:dienelactone hydrolase
VGEEEVVTATPIMRVAIVGLVVLLAAGNARADDARVRELLKGEPSGTAQAPALPRDPHADTKAARHALDFLKAGAFEVPYRLEPMKLKGDTYKKSALRFLSQVHTTDASDVVTGFYYEPATRKPGEKLPGVVIAHHLGGGMEAEEFLASWFAENGLPAVTIALSGYGERRSPNQGKAGFVASGNPLEMLDGMRQSILDVCRAGDVLRSLPGIDPSRVGVLGVSLGALVAADATALDPRFARTVLVVGGGDLYSLAANQVKGELGRVLELGKGLIRTATESVDPISVASRLRSADVLMLNAEKDEIFPRESTLALWRKIGYPKIRWFDSTHAGIVGFLPDCLGDALAHLTSKAPAREPD